MVNVCNEPFLFVLREGDVTAANARRALDKQIETEAAHLVIIAMARFRTTGACASEIMRVGAHARQRSRSDSRRRDGRRSTELQHAFDRVSQRALAEECPRSTPASVQRRLHDRHALRLMQRPGALKDLAESAVGALAGSLREI